MRARPPHAPANGTAPPHQQPHTRTHTYPQRKRARTCVCGLHTHRHLTHTRTYTHTPHTHRHLTHTCVRARRSHELEHTLLLMGLQVLGQLRERASLRDYLEASVAVIEGIVSYNTTKLAAGHHRFSWVRGMLHTNS